MIYTPGPARWHCLRSRPQGEQRAVAWLADFADAEAFYVARRVPIVTRGKKTEREHKLVPGYVFARVPGALAWHRVRELCPWLIGFIPTTAGEIAILDPRDLEKLYAMRARADDEQRQRDRARYLRKGDKVRLTGLMADAADGPVEVLRLNGDTVTVAIRIFGSVREIDAAADSVRKAG